MATRGVVAVGTGKRWRGVYNHWDSYPTGLGVDIQNKLKKEIEKGKTIKEICEELLKYTDWREYCNNGLCQYCGKVGLGQPHSISGLIEFINYYKYPDLIKEAEKTLEEYKNSNDEKKKYVYESYIATGYPDPEVKFHQHTRDNGETPEECHITSDYPDPLSIEWVYIINPNKETLTVLTSVLDKNFKEGDIKPFPKREKGGWWNYGHCCCRHKKVCEIKIQDILHGKVDWEKIEKMGEE